MEKVTQPIDPREIDKAKKKMEWLMGFMVVRYHFVYQILSMMRKTCSESCPTMGVRVLNSGNFELVYNPLFVNALKDEELTFVMYHEILHLALHHCTRRRFDNNVIGNLATDLAVNELIPIVSASCEAPTGDFEGQFVNEYRKNPQFADILNKQTAEWYYDYLQKKMKALSGCPGSCPDKNSEGDSEGKPCKNCKAGKEKFDDHGGWKECEIADERVKAKIEEIAKTDTWGSVGAVEKELIMAAQTRKINWRNLLRQFYGNLMWHTKESTRKRPNRRTGMIHPGSKNIHVDRHLVAIDTSGSIDSGLLSQFLGIVNQMTDYLPIDIMQCDCAVTEMPKPFNRKRAQFSFSGRGGTDFQPIMDVVTTRRYKSVVIFTDGQAAPCTKPAAFVTWVMPVGCEAPVDWGLKVHMNKHI